MTILTIWSESGGSGKTTTTLNTGSALSRVGKDILFCDLDPQPASLSQILRSSDKTQDKSSKQLYDSLLSEETPISTVITQTESYDYICSTPQLSNLESTVYSNGISMPEFLLRSQLNSIQDNYDYILIDPPATLSLLVDNALIASDAVFIPTEMTQKGFQSINAVQDTVSALESQIQRARPNFEIDLGGVIPNKVDNTRLSSEIQTKVQTDVNIPLVPTEIPNYSVLNKAWRNEMDIFKYNTKNGLKEYELRLLQSYQDLGSYIQKMY